MTRLIYIVKGPQKRSHNTEIPTFFGDKMKMKKIFPIPLARYIKVHIFWEGHKILRNLHRRFVLCSASQIYGGDFTKFCGLLRIYELYIENDRSEVHISHWNIFANFWKSSDNGSDKFASCELFMGEKISSMLLHVCKVACRLLVGSCFSCLLQSTAVIR